MTQLMVFLRAFEDAFPFSVPHRQRKCPGAEAAPTAVQTHTLTYTLSFNTALWQNATLEGQELYAVCFWDLSDLFICCRTIKSS